MVPGKEGALADTAIRYARLGNFSEAMTLATTSPPRGGTPVALGAISACQWRSGNRVAAEKTLQDAFNYEGWRMECYGLWEIALLQKRVGNLVGARKSFEVAIRVATKNRYKDDSWFQDTLARTQARIGDIEAAIVTANAIDDGLR